MKSVLPIIGTGLAIIEFSDNVEAHGLDGAIVRATPVLGDLISVYDLGSELADEMVAAAQAKADKEHAKNNEPIHEAWAIASEQTQEAFEELAELVPVTNWREDYNYEKKHASREPVIDLDGIEEALKQYRGRMFLANLHKSLKLRKFDYDIEAAHAKELLKQSLIRACQKKTPPASPPQPGPLT